ncbi:MAG TPA: hypothetical protein VLG08_09185, partial [Casimicrobiaceae bacterium]|nr:hypothetical protein [Casimicrobiaceae bacterium]
MRCAVVAALAFAAVLAAACTSLPTPVMPADENDPAIYEPDPAPIESPPLEPVEPPLAAASNETQSRPADPSPPPPSATPPPVIVVAPPPAPPTEDEQMIALLGDLQR